MHISKRRTFSKPPRCTTKDLVREQVNCKERNRIPVKFKPPSNWVNYSQHSSPEPEPLASWKPTIVRGQTLLSCCPKEEEKTTGKSIFFLRKACWTTCGSIEKKIPMGQGGGGEGSSFLSFWLGFILSSMKRNTHHVFHIKICTVFVLMLNADLACSAKDLLVNISTTTELEEWHV